MARSPIEQALASAAQRRAIGASAIEIAAAMIDAAFGVAAEHADFKEKVAARLRLGAAHPANRARFGARAERLRGRSLAAAIATVERWHRAEQRAYQLACAFGRPPRLSLTVLAELRLILRFLRRRGMADDFATVVESVCDAPTMLIAAE